MPDLPSPPPPALHPGTLQPAGPEDFAPLFPMELILQEVSQERYVEIPGGVLDVYRQWRPSPLFRAHRLEEALGTPARIYYKYEGVSPAGSHKPNTAVPQAYYNKQAGVKKLTTETGAGQWGTALALRVRAVRPRVRGVAGRVVVRQQALPPPDDRDVRRDGAPLALGPHRGRSPARRRPGELSRARSGIAISEAVEVAVMDPDVRYALGTVLNHVLMHQTIIGEEALLQLAKAGDTPTHIVGCTGGGSNFARPVVPVPAREDGRATSSPRIIAVEPASCPSLTHGVYAYDFGDTAGMTPLMKMHTLGHDFIPDPIHAGGLRYHGMAPLISHVYELGLMEAEAMPQTECFAAAVQFARTEGIVPAPEPTHALALGGPLGEARPRRPARRPSSSPRSAATGTSTSRRTTTTSTAAWSTRRSARSASPPGSRPSRRSRSADPRRPEGPGTRVPGPSARSGQAGAR